MQRIDETLAPIPSPRDAEVPSFAEVLAEQLRRAPWLLISLAGHALVLLLVYLVSRLEAPEPPPPPIGPLSVTPIPEDLPEEEPEVVLVEVDRSESPEEPEVAVDDSEMDAWSEVGEDALSESMEAGDVTGEGVGLGVGRGGKRGGRIGGSGPRQGGGGRSTDRNVAEGLRWLKRHQEADGHWDADEFDAHCEGEPCSGPGNGVHDVGLTGLALLAFLGDGHHPNRDTPYRRTVTRGVEWLASQIREGEDEGLVGRRTGHAFLYDHALAALALCDAYWLSRQENLREPAQLAVNFVLRARNPYKAWRYEAPPNGENDSSVTGWMVFVLHTAEKAGLDIDVAAYAGALELFDDLTDPNTGRCGYRLRGEAPARIAEARERFPASASESLTAVALLCRIFLGQTPKEHAILEAHSDLLSTKLPRWSADGSTNDLYYWYYGTFAQFQMGGARWEAWNRALQKALVPTQRQDGHARGSWDPIGPWGQDGGRIYSTALSVLCLEVYYRYGAILR